MMRFGRVRWKLRINRRLLDLRIAHLEQNVGVQPAPGCPAAQEYALPWLRFRPESDEPLPAPASKQ